MPDRKTGLSAPDLTTERQITDCLTSGIDADLLAFLRTQIDSFIKWDLVQFFYRNPNVNDTAESIARYIGCGAEIVRQEMVELSSGGILAESRVNGMRLYSLSRDPDVRELLSRFAESCDDQHFKIKAVYHILRAMR